ncbi:MAG: M55 family metallopeptidase [Victivallales bacterium]|nr:M55 family metallopeptidase [Victivallales bacterium]
MKVYIHADMEGISGISGSDFVLSDRPLYGLGRQYLTADVNACIRGCLRAGATEIIVRDGHCAGRNLLWDQLHPAAQLYQGQSAPGVRLPLIDGAAAAIFLGYHAMAGTPAALLEHSYSSRNIQNLWLNGEPVGEFAVDAAIAAEHGVPVVMVSGDDKVCAEARTWLPEVVCCRVKKSFGPEGCLMLSPEAAAQQIEEKTMAALAQAPTMPLRLVPGPVTMRKEMVERCRPDYAPDFRMVDGRTVETDDESVERVFCRLMW